MNYNKSLYNGLCAMIRLAKEKDQRVAENPDYMRLKKDFSYPGEVLERMKEKGYTASEDYVAVVYAIFMEQTDDSMFVGDQKENFAKEAEQVAVDNHNMILSALVSLVFHTEKNIAMAAGLTAGEFTEFIHDYYGFCGSSYQNLVPYFNACPGIPENMHALDIYKYAEQMKTFMYLGIWVQMMGRDFGLCREWEEFLSAIAPLANEPMKENSKKTKKLMAYGYSWKDILALNGAIFVNGYKMPGCLADKSFIKFVRLVRSWVHEVLNTGVPMSSEEGKIMADLAIMAFQRVVDGTNNPQKFFFESYGCTVTEPHNAAVLAKLCLSGLKELSSQTDYFKITWAGHFSLKNKEFLKKVADELSDKNNLLDTIKWLTVRRDMEDSADFGSYSKLLETFKDVFGDDVKNWICYSLKADRTVLDVLVENRYVSLAELAVTKPETAISYIRKCNSDAACEYFIKYWEDSKERKVSELVYPDFMRVETGNYYSTGRKTPPTYNPNLNKDLLAKAFHISLEICFKQGNYESTLMHCLEDEKLRILFYPGEAEELYRLMVNDPRETIRTNAASRLDRYFLTEEDIKAKQDAKEAARIKEKEDAQKAEENEIRNKFLSEIEDKPVNEQLKVLATNQLPGWGKLRQKIWLEIYSERYEKASVDNGMLFDLSRREMSKLITALCDMYMFKLISRDDIFNLCQKIGTKEDE